MPICAYCKNTAAMTREEVMPSFLSRNRPLDRTIVDHRRRQVRRGVVSPVRDVCETCNGGVLSYLDSYAAELDRKYFVHVIGFTASIRFEYDYDKLLRWLLKLSYNDDRTGESPFEAEMFVPYILGEASLPLRTNLLMGLISPSRTTEAQRAQGAPETIEPLRCGLGRLRINPPAMDDLAFGRFLQVYSYYFAVLAWKSRVPRPNVRRNLREICRVNSLVELRCDQNEVFLDRACMDFVSFRQREFDTFPRP